MDHGTEAIHNKSKVVIMLVVGGMLVLGIGAAVAVMKRHSGVEGGALAAVDGEGGGWCELRRQWAKKVDPMIGDIALKSVGAADKEERDALVRRRDSISRDFGKKVEALGVSDPGIIAVEQALVKEGKVRANISVEISNYLAKLPDDAAIAAADIDAGELIEQLRADYLGLTERMKERIASGEREADREVQGALGRIPGCRDIYRGPMTDMGTSGSPYISWQELTLMREQAAKQYKERIRLLEPREQYANQVYHAVMRHYGEVIRGCYRDVKRKNSALSSQVRLQLRLDRTGRVQTMALRKMQVPDERLVDCMLEKAARWRLPPSAQNGEVVVLGLDFDHM